ncbi:Lin0512 family protein [Ruegeria sp. THAF57]|uniref:Lin0512 family protein n=1 Tax=Ruegeria sp. THAF57 TaxID=2744555 RepID=UPI0015DD7A35|nr:Lin0512 family protein [Ruegeria sp. THAF57]
MGTDLKGHNHTKAAARVVHDALHRNFLVAGMAFDLPLDAMIVDIRVGVTDPDAVDLDVVKAEAPVGVVSAEAVKGGLEVNMMGHKTLIANAIVTVSYNVEMQS